MKRSTKIIFSFLTGQALFFRYGYDQWGIFMRPKVQLGYGQTLAAKIYNRLPKNRAVAWAIKILEIITDAGKMPIEGALYRKYGVVPDGVAAIVTQPAWSGLETTEKILGAVVHPERVPEAEAVKVSIGCIYGSLFRYATGAAIWVIGRQLARR